MPYTVCYLLKGLQQVAKNLFSKKTILFFGHFPNNKELGKDGYWQRVKTVDALFSEHNRIYLRFIYGFGRSAYFLPIVSKVSGITGNVFNVRLFICNPLHFMLAFLLVVTVGRVYIHSIFLLQQKLERFCYALSRVRFIDLHGVVPEEALFNEDKNATLYEDIEKFAIKYATKIVCVTNRMAEHVTCKYSVSNDKLAVLPLVKFAAQKNHVTKLANLNSVIYCGGLQKWQQMGKMLDFVHKHRNRLDFAFLVTEPDKILNEYREKYGEDFPGIICSVASDQTNEWYKKYAFGLVLREDNIVNNVAFPTKLVEYLQNDVVPIVDSPNIGDFVQLGYAYVEYNSNDLLDLDVWQSMISRNREVVAKVEAQVTKGMELLKQNI